MDYKLILQSEDQYKIVTLGSSDAALIGECQNRLAECLADRRSVDFTVSLFWAMPQAKFERLEGESQQDFIRRASEEAERVDIKATNNTYIDNFDILGEDENTYYVFSADDIFAPDSYVRYEHWECSERK